MAQASTGPFLGTQNGPESPPAKKAKSDQTVEEFQTLLRADRTIFDLMQELDSRGAIVECTLLDVVRLSISERLERLQPDVYQVLEDRIRNDAVRPKT